ncbi:DUF4297 family anti-phage-associated protein [Klebsiella aerogenes]|uniref:Uncharacterized protein n=1 Tax=Klebsiella aerogenes TaxID=548 RepID=A0AAP9U6L1_KLEAE|nr:DUF4297 family anti-phage-associated protein [Klebsiella aerogenes]QMR41599.1 hypothetical protein HV331_19795 [Klebsiella aerogenes]
MADRIAVDTIRGYFYQFDLTILSILKLKSLDESVEIECIEDIDIRTATDVTATQCKYYAKTEYNHSVIKDAIKYMLSHFKETLVGTKPKILYTIYGHYASGQEKLDVEIDIDFLKKHFLTYTKEKVTYYHHQDLQLTDANLEEFLKRLTINIKAVDFDTQYRELIDILQTTFNTKSFPAEYFYYNNSLAVIRELSIETTQTNRSITKRDFLRRINTSSILFNEWFVEKKGKKAHFAALRNEYFSEVNISPFERFFLVEIDPDFYVRYELKNLLFEISRKWSKLSKREPSPFCPYIYVKGVTDCELLALKNELSIEGFKITDGHDFHGAEFNCQSIILRATHGNGIKLKVLNTLQNVIATIDTITKTRRIYQFHIGPSFFAYDKPAVQHVKIQVEQFSDIKLII